MASASALLVLVIGLCRPSVARAETWGQYLVILDDSGSMDANDPKRLVMLASLALGAALSDADQVMITGLNQLSDPNSNPKFISPRELLAERDGSEGERTLAGEQFERMARHRGPTPCKQALDRAATLLEQVASAGAPQTLLMLTDGACSSPIDPATTWLARLTSHKEGRFRFALLTKRASGERVEPALVEYASKTGWTSDPNIAFDSRSLLRAFAEVLSFSRGLRYDDGGRVGLERSFAGAREVRVLAVSSDGKAPITLASIPIGGPTDGGRETAITGGPTYKHGQYGWSLRAAKTGAQEQPIAARSPDAGVEVLVIPSYGQLHLEAVAGPCGSDDESPDWTRERAVRSGQPACAWARLVGDRGETIHPVQSFKFEIELCEDADCKVSSGMQPAADGSFNAQLGIMPEGRSERWFRAKGGSLASPIVTRRGIQAVAFGITSVARADEPGKPIDKLDLGVLPAALPTLVTLEFSGSFPDGGEADVTCEVAGEAGEAGRTNVFQPGSSDACLRCVPKPAVVGLQDPFTVQVEVAATGLCPMISDGLGELPVALDLVVVGRDDLSSRPGDRAERVGSRRVPLAATLRHAVIEAQQVAVIGGEEAELALRFPAPVNSTVVLELVANGTSPKELEVALAQTELRVSGEAGNTAEVKVSLKAADCCTTGDYTYTLRVRDKAGGPELSIPVTVTVNKPSFWTCPGKMIAKWAALAAALGFLIWLIRGFTSPKKFGETAVLIRAESHEALAKVGEGDEDWRLIRSLESAQRGFYKPATLHLGGPKAALPSLRDLPDDARIEARGPDRDSGNATLVVKAEGIETFKESTGWTPVPVGELPIASSLVLRRDNTYLMFRR